jgi:hypothetical protein
MKPPSARILRFPSHRVAGSAPDRSDERPGASIHYLAWRRAANERSPVRTLALLREAAGEFPPAA